MTQQKIPPAEGHYKPSFSDCQYGSGSPPGAKTDQIAVDVFMGQVIAGFVVFVSGGVIVSVSGVSGISVSRYKHAGLVFRESQ